MTEPIYPHITINISDLDVIDLHRQLGLRVVDAMNRAGVDRNVVIDYSRLSMSLSSRSLREYTEKLVYVIEQQASHSPRVECVGSGFISRFL